MNQCWMADCVTRRASASGWAQAPPPGGGVGSPPSCSCGGDGSAAASGDGVILLVEAFPGACGDGVPRGELALPEAGPSAHTQDVPPRACPRGRGAAMQQPILVLSASLTHTSHCRCVCHSLTCAPLLAQTKTPSATPGGKRSRATLQLPRSAPACLCVSRGLRPSRAPTSAAASDAPVSVVVHQAVADIIRTTLGPQSMLKMLLDASGGACWTRLPRVVCPTLTVSGRLRPARLTPGIVLTNDGNAILREIDVSHPAAKARGPRLWRLLRGVAPPRVPATAC